jgi:protocatechuate 3,4-dioxygenase beta subunit
VRTQLGLSHLSIRPGVPARVEIEVTNTSDVIDGVTAIVDGIDPNWIRFDSPVVSLFPSSTAMLGFTIDTPFDYPAGDYLVVVRVVSTIDADRQTVHDFWITVEPSLGVDMRIRPSIINGGRTAEIVATVRSTGNTTAMVGVSALDPGRQVDCRVVPPELAVPPGAEGDAIVRLRGPRPWFGQPVSRSVVITARSHDISDDLAVEQVATFNQKPRIPRGVLTFLLLAGIIALWATIFLLVANALGSGDEPGKAVASDFNGGRPNVPLAAIAGTASGRVTASTTGEGLPRITVEASRLDAAGDPVPTGSAATDEAGSYELASLLPGTYTLSFSADGYDTVWYPDATSEAEAAAIEITPKANVPDLDVVLTGQTASFSGSIAVPESAAAPILTVTATQVVDDGSEPVPFTQETTGQIDLQGLPAPATYLIRVEGSDFAPQEFEVEVAAGQVNVLNTVTLGAAEGSIAGIVLDAAGRPLGGVKVEATSGELVLEATTPTSGNVGEFVVVGLETPRTYVLSFTLEGFSSQTVALDLLAGENRTGITATLVGGVGTGTGTARDPAGDPIGGATVVVAGNEFEATTSTLTTGGIGSYRVSDIPVPGSYTITVSAPGYLPETIRVGFIAAGEQTGLDVVLRPSTARVGGTVTAPDGSGIGDVAVELSDGTDEGVRTTATTTSPAGGYVFTDIAPGTYTLRFTAPGRRPFVALVQVGAGDVIDRSVQLQPGTG